MDLLDIGGGFCSGAGFKGGVPCAVNTALAEYFPVSMGVHIIAEPGRSVTCIACSSPSDTLYTDIELTFMGMHAMMCIL